MTVSIATMELENDMEVLEHGRHVFTIWSWHIRALDIDRWVRMVALVSGQRLDWFYYCDRVVVVKALGNIRKVKKAIKQLLPKLQAVALEEFSRQCSLGHNVRR